MKQRFNTKEQAELFIAKIDTIKGYPDNTGTTTYAIPEEGIEVVDEVGTTHYDVEITSELAEVLVEIAVKQLTTAKL